MAAEMIRGLADVFSANGDRHMYGAWLSWGADYAVAAGTGGQARGDVDESLRQARAADCASCESQALAGLAIVTDAADDRLAIARSALRLSYGIGEVWSVLCGLDVIVGALADSDLLADAALLSGAVESLRVTTGMAAVLPGRTAARIHGDSLARIGLKPSSFGELVRDGAALDYASTVAHALG
jgi:hypothetical protein